jgi:hypothetical protein
MARNIILRELLLGALYHGFHIVKFIQYSQL